MPKISIIVPAYNCEGTIEKCILSVINQSFLDWELILIDDGSIDNTREICRRYADSIKIFLYSQQNSGVSSARNFGIKKATGEYLLFVDSDDFLLEDALSIIHDSMKGKDICFYNYQIIKLNKKITEVRNTLTSKVNLQNELPNLMRILVERVEVEKINGDRKHVKLIIYFNFNTDTIYRELEIDNKRKSLSYQLFI